MYPTISMKNCCGLLMLLLLCKALSYSQHRIFSFQHYGPEEGLSNTNVFAIKQDANRILYMATDNGVYDFDGYNFHKVNPKTPLKSNDTRNIGFSQNNDLIIINRREGIFSYDKYRNEASLIKNLAFNNFVDELIIDKEYSYSLTDQISVTAIEARSGKTIEDEIKAKNHNNQAFSIYKTSQNTILVGRTDGLYQFKGGRQIKLNLQKEFSVYSITEDQNGIVYLGSDNAIYCIEKDKIAGVIPIKSKRQDNFFSVNNTAKVTKLMVDKYKRIWFTNAPDDNLYLIENNLTYDAFELLGIDKVLINAIYKDIDDNIWIATYNEGVFFIQNPQLQNISFNSGRKILPVNCAEFIDNNIAIGTDNGFFIFDNASHHNQTVIAPDDLFGEKITSISSFKNNVVYAKNNSLANKSKLFSINSSNYVFSPIAARLFNYSENSEEAYIADDVGNLLNIKNHTHEAYTVLDTLISFPDYRTKINTLLSTPKSLLVGTSDGLYSYDKTHKTYQKHQDELFNFSVNHIERFHNKTYIAHENGITVLEDSALIQQIGKQRLTAVKKIKFYRKKIWIATLDGLFICDETFNPIVVYNKSNGLLSNTINDIVFKDSNCCICTNKGITLCSINNLIQNIHKATKVFISSIEIDGELANLSNQTLHLKSSQSDVAIRFLSPLFVKPNKQYYRYKFNNSKWLDLENTQVRVSSIEGGTHQLEIICSYDGFNWSEPYTITIKKDIPFKQTIWFAISIVAGCVLLILIIAFGWIKRVRAKAAKRVQEDQQVNLLKHQAMNSLMSPHFIFNSLTSIQNYIHSNDSLKASEYLAKFSRLIRMIIEKASQSDITLHEELTRLNYYLDLEKERFKGKFDFHLNVEEGLNTFDIKIPNMIIQPYAENSIIHGILPKHEHGTLMISFKKDEYQNLLIIIEDDGIGFNQAKQNAKIGHKSLGTKTIESILELNTKLTGKKQTVEIVDKTTLPKPGKGTRITITLQIS